MSEWQERYEMLRDAVLQYLPQCVLDDDVAEEHIIHEAIRTAGRLLRNVKLNEDTALFEGRIPDGEGLLEVGASVS